jgi:hypothetical protein
MRISNWQTSTIMGLQENHQHDNVWVKNIKRVVNYVYLQVYAEKLGVENTAKMQGETPN